MNIKAPIIIRCVWPPIPVRSFDYAAFHDGDEETPQLIGWGETEDAARADLAGIEAEFMYSTGSTDPQPSTADKGAAAPLDPSPSAAAPDVPWVASR